MILNKDYRPRPTKLTLAALAFVFVVGLADILGANPYRSFFSNYERMEGYMIFHLGLYFLVLSNVFKTKKEWNWYFGTIVLSSLFVSFYALLQKFGVYQSLQGGNRVDGTIGNPAYLAAYLMLTMFLSFYLFNSLKSIKQAYFRYAFLAVAVFELVIIYFTATRGVTLGLLGGTIAFAVFYILFSENDNVNSKKLRMYAVTGLALLIIIPSMLYFMRDYSLVKNNAVLNRLTNISLSEKTIRSRFMIWGMAWQGVKERPVLGWGQENFNIIFSKFYNPGLYDQEPWFDRSHNIVFDWMINAGIVGFLSYLSLFGTSFYLMRRAVKNGVIPRIEAMIFFTALVSYFAQNIFVFDNMNTYYIFFAILAYINGTYAESGASVLELRRDNQFMYEKRKFAPVNSDILIPRALASTVALGVVIAAAIYILNIKPLQQSRTLIGALRANAENRGTDAVFAEFKNALSYNSFGNSEVREQLAQHATNIFNDKSIPEDKRRAMAMYSVNELEKQALFLSGDVKYRLFLSNLYMNFSSADPSYGQKTESSLLEALDRSPTKQPIYFGLAQYYFNSGQQEKAFEISEKAVDLAPNYVDAQLNLVMIAIYLRKNDLVADKLNKVEEAINIDADRANQNRSTSYPKIAGAFASVNNYEQSALYYLKSAEFEPKNLQYRSSLVYAYAKLGKNDLAIAEAKKIAEIDPNTQKDVDAFIKQIESGQPIP